VQHDCPATSSSHCRLTPLHVRSSTFKSFPSPLAWMILASPCIKVTAVNATKKRTTANFDKVSRFKNAVKLNHNSSSPTSLPTRRAHSKHVLARSPPISGRPITPAQRRKRFGAIAKWLAIRHPRGTIPVIASETRIRGAKFKEDWVIFICRSTRVCRATRPTTRGRLDPTMPSHPAPPRSWFPSQPRRLRLAKVRCSAGVRSMRVPAR